MRLRFGAAILALSPLLCFAEPASACEQAAFASVVSNASTLLSTMNDEHKKAFQAKLATLKSREGWADGDYAAKATPFIKDATTSALDEDNKALLDKVPLLGGAAGAEAADAAQLTGKRCAMLSELRAMMAKVVENTRAKWAHMLGKVDAALDEPRQAKAAGQ